jgi:hypothetical protein
MLTDQEKARIKAEEEYRAQVRRGIKSTRRSGCGCGPIVVLFALVSILIGVLINNSSPKQTPNQIATNKKAYNLELQAIKTSRVCHEAVKNRLKAPKTADFPDDSNTVSNISLGRAVLVSYVDAQNGFSAMLRTTYRCEVILSLKNEELGEPVVTSLQFDK